MGLDHNAIKILLWAKNLGVDFERSVTLGHQGLDCSPARFRRVLRDFGFHPTEAELRRCLEHGPCSSLYADEFLRFLGAKEAASVDRSDFEAATLVHDLNQRFPEEHRAYFSMVLDGGTLEHVFDFPSALRHSLELVALGGAFITTAVPAQNLMGHGFYQMSPELLFRVFSAENGFVLRKIVIYDTSLIDAPFFEVHDPAVSGLRTQLNTARPMHLAAVAQRTELKPILARPPQQSDYVAAWERHQANAQSPAVAATGLSRLRTALNPFWPYWLRSLRRKLAYRRRIGPSTLSNSRQFRRLLRREIFAERAAPLPVKEVSAGSEIRQS